ncbi:hypothetical protein KAX17_05335, partial [Candidatus Bipolaricaulota bacterium]|nr:hypothetical protein [Candidatus Bipolaricaulota bacterium]
QACQGKGPLAQLLGRRGDPAVPRPRVKEEQVIPHLITHTHFTARLSLPSLPAVTLIIDRFDLTPYTSLIYLF